MSMVIAQEIEVGVSGQQITVRGVQPPRGTNAYAQVAELQLTLPLAREMYRLLGKMIPLAEQAKPLAPVVELAGDDDAA